LAIDARFNGQGYGRRLLVDALRRSFEIELGAVVIVVDAIDEAAQRFYEHFGFALLPDRGNRLYIPMSDVAQLIKP